MEIKVHKSTHIKQWVSRSVLYVNQTHLEFKSIIYLIKASYFSSYPVRKTQGPIYALSEMERHGKTSGTKPPMSIMSFICRLLRDYNSSMRWRHKCGSFHIFLTRVKQMEFVMPSIGLIFLCHNRRKFSRGVMLE